MYNNTFSRFTLYYCYLLCFIMASLDSRGTVKDLKDYKEEEIKEYHFHVYFFQSNERSHQSALELRQKILDLIEVGFFRPVPYHRVNTEPRGPHPVGSYEVWCPKEHFSRVYSWFLLNRGEHSVMVHPLTKLEVKDHTERAVWMGNPVDLDTSRLSPMLPDLSSQYPELGLGYAAGRDSK